MLRRRFATFSSSASSLPVVSSTVSTVFLRIRNNSSAGESSVTQHDVSRCSNFTSATTSSSNCSTAAPPPDAAVISGRVDKFNKDLNDLHELLDILDTKFSNLFMSWCLVGVVSFALGWGLMYRYETLVMPSSVQTLDDKVSKHEVETHKILADHREATFSTLGKYRDDVGAALMAQAAKIETASAIASRADSKLDRLISGGGIEASFLKMWLFSVVAGLLGAWTSLFYLMREKVS